MPTVTFWGKLQPAIANIQVKNAPKFVLAGGELEGYVTIEVNGGNVQIECVVDEFSVERHLEVLMRVIYETARMLTSMISFGTGIALTLVLDVVVLPGGELSHLLPKDNSLSELCGAFTIPHNPNALGAESDGSFTKVLNLLIEDQALRMALDTLTSTLAFPDLSAINCARVMEHLRNLITPRQGKAQGWANMRELLNVELPYLKLITDNSLGPRHGDFSGSSAPDVFEARKRSWIIMSRYLEFKKRGGIASLPLASFPLLKH